MNITFENAVKEHIRGLVILTEAMQNREQEKQEAAVLILKRNIDQWVNVLNSVFAGSGYLLKQSFKDTVQDEIQLVFGILQCKCMSHEPECCNYKQLAQKANTAMVKNHKKTVKYISSLKGDAEKWTRLWSEQLNKMRTYFISVSQQKNETDVKQFELDCYQAGQNLASSLNHAFNI
jgi:hypothetical protein